MSKIHIFDFQNSRKTFSIELGPSCLKSRDKEGLEADHSMTKRCNDATLLELFRTRVGLLDNHNPIDEDTGKPICDHWSIGKKGGESQGRVRFLQFELIYMADLTQSFGVG